MNVQTEHQPDHTARLTVEIDEATFEGAKQKAARALSQKVNIPGFRKGKVPLRVLTNYVGEGAIIEEAVDQLSQDVYRKALIESGVEPYGPGALVDIKAETLPPSLIYTVPLQPTVDLGEYRDLRLDWETPTVTDEQVDRSMKALQERESLVEDSARPAAQGDRVTLAMHSYFLDDGAEAEGEAHDHEHDHDHEGHDHEGHDHADDAIHAHMSNDQEVFLHEHAMEYTIDPDDDIAPGFAAALVGINPGETREFTLDVPEDNEDPQLAGRSVRFIVTANKVQTQTLPALNDEFAARVTQDEEKPLSLLELRVRTRENLQKAVEGNYKQDYSRRALDAMVEVASVAYPEAMVNDHIESLLEEFDQRLRRSGITLDDYMKINQKTKEDLYADWRDAGINSVKRSLILRELVDAERLTVDESQVDAELERFLEQFPEENRDNLRQALMRDSSMRDSVRSSLLQDTVFERLIVIAKGEAPEVSSADVVPTDEVEPTPSEETVTSENSENEETE